MNPSQAMPARGRSTSLALVALALPSLAGCPAPTAFLTATHAFAQSARTSVDALRPAAAGAQGTCLARAEAAFVRARLAEARDREHGEQAPPSVKRSAWFDSPAVGPVGGVAWSSYCQEIGQAQAALVKVYGALGDYADALRAVKEGAAVDADKVAAAAKEAGALVEALDPATAGSSGARLVAAAQGATGPLRRLGSAIELAVADRKVQETVRRADPAVQELLEQLDRWAQAALDEALVLQDDTRVLLDWIDGSLARTRPDALRVAEAARYMRDAERSARDRVAAQRKVREALAALREAHAALRRAAAGELGEREVGAAVAARCQAVTDAVASLQQLQRGELAP